MLLQLEGSQAISRAVALCRPGVICAYPITPQTHVVEDLGQLVHSGELKDCDYINVESEMAALSVTIGTQAAGVRSYTATSSQGLLYMIEAVYNASGLELPIVMTLGNRAIGSPINIWNDHSDAMSARDAGWIMLFPETNQEAADLHIQAFKIAEMVRCPVMVCVDGFVLTHAYEQVDIPSQEEVDDFLPPYKPYISLDAKNPLAIGTMVPPEYFMEVRYLAHKRQSEALGIVDCVGKKFHEKFGRQSSGLIRTYNTENTDTIIVAMGSVLGTIKDTVDELNAKGGKFGVVSIVSYRPFPAEAIKAAIGNAKRVVVLEKALAVGIGGILSKEVELVLRDTKTKVVSTIVGLGGRIITKKMLADYLLQDHYEAEVFLGIDNEIVEREHKSIKGCCCKQKVNQ
ncbi:2-ketoisovalerate ferredoxin oxidoreductase subunit alpha [Alphaproteobacteria bacterium]|nr:2-ketoisovalerate ferredoxin oxidoreductase subunit alpha [Alphaproteobacteria bacterium]